MQTTKQASKTLSGTSFYIFAAKFFPALALSIVWVVASKSLEPNNYGAFQKFWTQLFLLSAIGGIGFPVFILTYNPAKAIAIAGQIISKHLKIIIVFILAIAILFGLLQYHNHSTFTSLFAICLLLLQITIVFSDAIMIVFKNFKALITINLIYAVGFVGIHWLSFSRYYSLSNIILGLCVLCFLRVLIALFFIRKKFQFYQEEAQQITLDLHEQKQSLSLWKQLGLNELITQLFRWIDKFILSFLLTQELFALYFNGSTEFQFLAIIFSAVSSAAIQHWAQQHKSQSAKDKIPLLIHSTRILSSIMLPLFGFFIFYHEAFLSTIFSPQYLKASSIFICTQLVLPVRCYPFTAILQSEHRGDIINKGAIIDFGIACLLMFPLYLLLGLPGIALSFVISTYWQAAYYLKASARISGYPMLKLFPFQLIFGRLILFGSITAISYLFATKFFEENLHQQFILGCCILLILITGSLLREWNNHK